MASHSEALAVPSPVAVVDMLLTSGSYYLRLTQTTVVESILGLFIATVAAVTMASFAVAVPNLEGAIFPLAVLIKATPAIAFAPLLALYVRQEIGARALLGATICFFPLFVGAIDGARETPDRLIVMMRSYGCGRVRALVHVKAVYGVLGLLSAEKMAAPMAVIGAVVGEWMGQNPPGIGRLFRPVSNRTEFLENYCGVLLTTAVGMSLFALAWTGWWLVDRRLHLRR